MMMEIIKITVPIMTFFLGALFTFLYWKIDREKKKERESIQEIAKLVNEWYDQLHDIRTDKLKMQEYYLNRKVLPKLRQHIEILRNKKKYQPVVKAAVEFLDILTYGNESGHIRCCTPTLFEKFKKGSDIERAELLDYLLQETDIKLQEINVCAGRILSKL